jgi:LacI family transcriptional regulator
VSVTIKDVAQHAKVSVKTVSRVINHEAPVRDDTRIRVLHSIQELGYVANVAAQRLARGRSKTIAFVYFNASWHYTNLVMRGVLETCMRHDYSILLHPLDSYQADSAECVLRLTTQGSVDGFIFTPPSDRATDLLDKLTAMNVPFVRLTPCDRERNWPWVAATDWDGARDMTEFLLSLGHRRIGFIKGPQDQRAGQDRFDAFEKTLTTHSIAIDPKLVRQGNDLFEAGFDCACRLLQTHPRPTAIFANNDEMASGVLIAAHQQGIKVPTELSVVGFDDTPLARQVWPALTTVRQPVLEIAQIAAELLIRHLEGEVAEDYSQEVATELIIRESTGPAPQTTISEQSH